MFLSRTVLFVSFLVFALPCGSAQIAESSALPSSLESSMARCGITPSLLTAAGVPASAVVAVLTGASVPMLDGGNSALAVKDVAIRDAARQLVTLRRQSFGDESNQETVSSIAQLEAAIASLEGARDDLLLGFFQAGLSVTSNQAQSIAQTIRDNATRGIPDEFMVIDRSEEEWLLLKRCLTNERTSEKVGLDPDEELQGLLASFRSTPEVGLAKALLDTNLGQVEAAWLASFEN